MRRGDCEGKDITTFFTTGPVGAQEGNNGQMAGFALEENLRSFTGKR